MEFRRAGWQRQVEARRLVVRRRHDVEQKSSSRPYPEITSNTFQMMCGSLRENGERPHSLLCPLVSHDVRQKSRSESRFFV